MRRLASPEGITPSMVWTRSLGEVKAAGGSVGTSGTDGTVGTAGGMNWKLESITNSQRDEVWQSACESEPEAEELKSLPLAIPQAMPEAKSVRSEMSIQSESGKAHLLSMFNRRRGDSLKRKRKGP